MSAKATQVTLSGDTMQGTLYINGQVVVGVCSLTVPRMKVNAQQCASQNEREQFLIDKALELNPDLVLMRAGKLFGQDTKDAAND